jgi:hypothetical protein
MLGSELLLAAQSNASIASTATDVLMETSPTVFPRPMIGENRARGRRAFEKGAGREKESLLYRAEGLIDRFLGLRRANLAGAVALHPHPDLLAIHGDFARGLDPEPDLASLNSQHLHFDVVPDHEGLLGAPRQDQHVTSFFSLLLDLRSLTA